MPIGLWPRIGGESHLFTFCPDVLPIDLMADPIGAAGGVPGDGRSFGIGIGAMFESHDAFLRPIGDGKLPPVMGDVFGS